MTTTTAIPQRVIQLGDGEGPSEELRSIPDARDNLEEDTAEYLPEHEALLDDQHFAQTDQRWQQIQASFVDDPRNSVAQAHELVGEVVQRIVSAFSNERNELERQWSKGDNVSTEELRVCLQRYRAFFSRLLPSMPEEPSNAE